jgi:ACT domain-containing protein
MEEEIMSIPSSVPLEGKAALTLETVHSLESELARVVDTSEAIAAVPTIKQWRMVGKLFDQTEE